MARILVTGGNRGVGRAIVDEALARGHEVVVSVRHRKDAIELRSTASAAVKVLIFDVTDAEGISRAAEGFQGHLDILINNAGIIGPQRQSTLDMDFDGFAETLDVNVLGPLRVTQAFMPHLRRSNEAKILTISSQMGMMGYQKSDRIAYRASKAAVNKVMQGLATDLHASAIAVLLVHPGWVRTDMGGQDADISPKESAMGILDRAEELTMGQSGTFVSYDGSAMSW